MDEEKETAKMLIFLAKKEAKKLSKDLSVVDGYVIDHHIIFIANLKYIINVLIKDAKLETVVSLMESFQS
jgi:hypothetical protein